MSVTPKVPKPPALDEPLPPPPLATPATAARAPSPAGFGSTILTSPMTETVPKTVRNKSLLGQ